MGRRVIKEYRTIFVVTKQTFYRIKNIVNSKNTVL